MRPWLPGKVRKISMHENQRAQALLDGPILAVNIGLELLGQALQEQQVDTAVISWRPPRQVSLSPRILEILSQIEEE